MAYIKTMRVVRTRRYQRDLKRLGLRDAEIAALEEAVAGNPLAGSVIPGLGGIRKLRFSLGGKGKRGGGRVIYFLVLADDTVFMLFAYAKAHQTDLSEEQRRLALAIVKELTDG
jgi:hypothetical protein